MRKPWVYIVFMCLLTSCAHIEQAKETPVTPPAIPSPVAFQLEREKAVAAPREEEPFSFSLREADIKDILRAIGKQANHNMVIEPDVKGTTTVDLRNVTLTKALEYILEPLGFTCKIEGNTIYVSKPKTETKIFYVNYIALKKTGSSNVYATPGAITTSTATTSSTSGSQVSVKSDTESDFWKSIEDNVKGILSKEGKFVVNKQSMMILVTDYPRILKDIEQFLKAAEGVVHRQVMIEAKIVEVQLNDDSRQGINWSIIDARIGEFAIKGQQSFFNQLISVPSLTAAVSGTPFFRIFTGNNNLDINNTFIDLLQIFGKVETISSPKIATLNNQRAIIKVTTQDVYFEVQQTAATGSANPTITYTPRFVDIGLTLDVTPQIDDRGTIILNVHPIMSERVGDVATPGTGSTKVPILNVREVDTIIKVREAETVVIGGLIKNRKSTIDTGTKWLMSIPIIGQFFKLTEKEDLKSELVIFLTPRIVYGESN